MEMFFDSQDLMFYGPLERCPVCNGQLECTGRNYECRGAYSEWSACVYNTRDNPRKDESLKLPEGIESSKVNDVS